MIVFLDGRLDGSDVEFITGELAKQDIVAEGASPQGVGPSEWIVVLEWIRDETEQMVFTSTALVIGQRLWRRFKDKNSPPPDRVNITQRGKTFSAPVSEDGGIAGEVRRLIFYGPEAHCLRVLDELKANGYDVYRFSRIPADLIAKTGETHPFALISPREFDENLEADFRTLLETLRTELGDFRVYEESGNRDI